MKTRMMRGWVLGLVLAAAPAPWMEAQEVPVSPAVLTAQQPVSANPTRIPVSFWLAELVKLAQAGIESDVMLSFVDSTEGTFNLGADQIILLRNLGVGTEIINAVIQHDKDFTSGIRRAKASTVPTTGPVLHFQPVSTGAAGSAAPAEGKPSGASNSDATASSPSVPQPASASQKAPDAAVAAEEPAVESPEWDIDPSPELAYYSPLPGPHTSTTTEVLYRVRTPHAVQLADPILVFRGEVRQPNVVLLRFAP